MPSLAHYEPYDRYTLTYPALDRSKLVLFFVLGAKKAEALGAIARGEDRPSARVRPTDGHVIWIVDRAAAKDLAVTPERLARYADLIVKVGANVAPGQDVQINSIVDNAPLCRAVARAAYEAGARYVDVWYFDQHVRRARLDHAPLDSLAWTPPWLDARNEEIERVQGARIAIFGGLPDPHLLDGVDPERAGLDRMPRLAELAAHLARRRRQLGRRQLPEPGLGELDLRRARRGSAVDGDRARGPPERTRSGRGLGGALRASRGPPDGDHATAPSRRCTSAAPAPTSASA